MAINPNDLSRTATLTFAEEFDTFRVWNGASGLDTVGGPQWAGRVSTSGTLPYNNELQWYVRADEAGAALPNPFSVSAGALAITARPADAALQPMIQGQRYTSGLISTHHAFSQTYGYFEMRAQMPAGQGLWPAFWLLGADGAWPPEIDVMEMLGHQTTTLHTTIHSKIEGQRRASDIRYETTSSTTVADMSVGFHTYGLEWRPDAITWYFDGRKVFEAATPADMNKPMYMVANLAVGGDWPRSPDATTQFPATMTIDHIRAYAEKPAGATADGDTLTLGYALSRATIGKDANGDAILLGPNGARDAAAGFETYVFTDGAIDRNAKSALVDDLFYNARNGDVWAARMDATAHYDAYGWREGRDPSADFSTVGYLAANPTVDSAKTNPLAHYVAQGWKEGRDPSAGFDNELYLAANPDVRAAGIAPLAHYLEYGAAEGRDAHAAIGRTGDIGQRAGFDAAFYLLANGDVAQAARAAGGDTFAFAQQHYASVGWCQGRDPNAVFDVSGYLDAYADVKAAAIDPLAHYHAYGWREGRDPAASFDTELYAAKNADVARAGIDPMLHYLQYGALEGRSAFSDGHFG